MLSVRRSITHLRCQAIRCLLSTGERHGTMRLRACSADVQICACSSSAFGTIVTDQIKDDTKAATDALAAMSTDTIEKPPQNGQEHIVADNCYAMCTTMLNGVWKLLNRSEFRCDQIQGGLSNDLYLCGIPDEMAITCGEPRKVVVRFFGEILKRNVHSLVLDSVVFALLSERKFGPKLFGVFPGGRIEQYIPSRSLRTDELWLPAINKQVAEKMAAFHGLEMPLEKAPRFVFDTMYRWLLTIKQERLELPVFEPASGTNPALCIDALPRSVSNGACNANAISPKDDALPSECSSDTAGLELDYEAELEWLKRSVGSHATEFPVVFCHNDLQEGNILFLDDAIQPDGFRLLPIDFEYCSYNYRAFDFGNYFCEWTYDYSSQNAPYYIHRPEKYPNREQRRFFFETYLSAQSQTTITLTNSDQDALDLEAAYGALMSHLYWSLWSIVQHRLSSIRFGYLSYARDRMFDYLRMKRYVLALEERSKSAVYP